MTKDLNESQTLEPLYAKAKVVEVEGGYAYVLTQRETGCSGCRSQKGCGTATLAQLFAPESKTPIKIENTLHALPDDEVILSLNQSDLIKHSFMAYGLPLLGLFAISALFHWMFASTNSELPMILGGFFGLGLGWWITRNYYQPEQPKMDSIIGGKND